MAKITREYLEKLAPIYRDILQTYPIFNPSRKPGIGLPFQTLYSALSDKHSLAEIREACKQMARGGVIEIRDGIYAHPTEVGEELITALSGNGSPVTVPPFTPPPSE